MLGLQFLILISLTEICTKVRSWQVSSSNSPRRLSLLMKQAPFKAPSRHNVPGNFYVDVSCIDCDVCRWMCPSVYSRKGMRSAVTKQPEGETETLSALAAMVACPVGAIRTYKPEPMVKEALDLFPAPIDAERLPEVYHCGFHSAQSFAATSYFIKRPAGCAGGNIMIDCPRFNSRLADNIEAEGGLHTMILTHKDDVADHEKWKKRFPQLTRIMHMADVEPETQEVEVQLQGEGVWFPFDLQSHLRSPELDADTEEEAEKEADIAIIHTPGHTAGSLCVLYDSAVCFEVEEEVTSTGADNSQSTQLRRRLLRDKRETVLFSGDTIAFDAERQRLDTFPLFNHGALNVQLETVERIFRETGGAPGSDKEDRGTLDFQWILPGHGRMIRFQDTAQRQRMLAEAVADLRLALNLEDTDPIEAAKDVEVGMKKMKWTNLLRPMH